jgi:signal peptidase I
MTDHPDDDELPSGETPGPSGELPPDHPVEGVARVSRSPIERLRDVGEVPSTRPVPAAPEPVSPEPELPPPSVIAVGDRPGAYRSSTDDTRAVPGEEQPETGRRVPRGTGRGSFLKELPLLLAIAVVLALLIKTFLVQAFFIPSGSMQQTLHIHDRVLVNKLDFRTGSPQRGEIVVFNTAGTQFGRTGLADGDYQPCPASNGVVSAVRAVQRFVGVGTCGQDDFIKRIIAVPGDTIQCCTAGGQVILDGKPLAEPYLYVPGAAMVPGTQQPSQAGFPFCAATEASVESPSHTYSVSNSCTATSQPITVPAGMYWVMGDHRNDSEDSRYNGFVPKSKLLGRAFVRIWPPSRFAFLRVPSSFSHVGAVAVGAAGTPALAAPALAVPLIGGRVLRRRHPRRRSRLRGLVRR